MSKELLLGVDLGTTVIKASFFSIDGTEVASNAKEVMVEFPRPAWAEQDPESLWRTTASVIREAIEKNGIDPSNIIGVSFSGQMHGTFLIDENGFLARKKAVIWLDSRSSNILRKIYDDGLAETIYDIAGWKPITSMQLLHLLWLHQNEHDTLKKADKFLACKDYIRYRMTGMAVTDYTDASVTGLFDINSGRWSEKILDLTGLSIDCFPEVKGSWENGGVVTAEAARETGLLEGTPVAVGSGDICSTALGAGAIQHGMLTAIIGTAGIYELSVDKVIFDSERKYSIAYHAVPNRWLLAAVQMTAGASLKWFKDQLCDSEIAFAEKLGVSTYSLLDKLAEQSPIGSNGLIFHPFLQGERSPFVNPDARGVFYGIGLWTRKKDLIRAVLEGVAFAGRDNMEVFKKQQIKISEVRMTGGGAKSNLWCKIFADVLDLDIKVPKVAECGALGAAIQAAVLTGVFKNHEQAVNEMVKIIKEYKPSPEAVTRYQKLFELYRKLYSSIWDFYSEAAKVYS